MSAGAWSIEIDHDPSPMLIQWGYDPSNPSSISCQLVLGPLNDHDPSPMLIQWAMILQIHRQFHCQLVLGH
jgi:uncharacterized protein (DUF2249 family)